MKNNYIIPETMFVKALYNQSILAGSTPHINNDGNVVVQGEGDAGDASEGCTKGRDTWNKDGLWCLLLSLFLFAVPQLNLQAQISGELQTGKTSADVESVSFTQLNGTIVTFASDQLDHVTHLPGVGMKIYGTGSTTSLDYLFSQMSSITYSYSSSTGNNANANWNIVGLSIPRSKADPDFTHEQTDNYAWRLEYPHINTGNASQRVVTATNEYGITYSIEWDNSLIANRWTCYTMCAQNNASNVSRSDDFKSDPDVITSPSSSYVESGTYSRGHLCPSADRLASTEQNKQTFYMTNMQPQYKNHNGGLWSTLEGYVRSKWQPTNADDTLYVVKAATIGDVTLNGSTGSGTITTTTDSQGHTLLVPKYFYMAFLYYDKGNDTYKAFALWTEHLSSNNANATTVINNRISIDELENRTGIDFFCNLPDDIEATVEATATYWDNSNAKMRTDDIPEADEETLPEANSEAGAEIALW